MPVTLKDNIDTEHIRTTAGSMVYDDRVPTEDAEGASYKHRIAEIHATSMKRLSKVEATDDPQDGAEVPSFCFRSGFWAPFPNRTLHHSLIRESNG